MQATKIFSPTFVNEAKFGYTLNNLTSDFEDKSLVMRSRLGNLPQLYADAGAPDYAPDVNFGGQPANTIKLTLGPGDWYWRGTEFTYTDNLSKVWSRHTLKAGFNVDYYRAVAMDTRSQWRGAFNFGRDTNNPFDSNHGFSNALLGNFASYTELTSRALKNTVLKVFEEYVQDNWRVTKRLTLDFGIRAVHQPPEFDLAPSTAHFDPAYYQPGKSPSLYAPAMDGGKRVGMDPVTKRVVPAALIGMFVPNSGDPANGSRVGGKDGYPRGLFTRSWIFLAPRFGFAYDVFGNGRTAVRGGFGVFYDTADANSYESSAGNPPLSYIPVQYYGNVDTMGSSTGVIGPSTLASQAAIGRMPLPLTMNFSLGIQHQAARSMLIEASYVGSQVRHGLTRQEINPIAMYARFDARNADPTSPGRPLPDNFFRPYQGYGSVTPYEMTATSSYNALQTSLSRRFARGLQFGVSYTFSKVLGSTAVSSYFPTRQWNYGPLGHDRTHVFVANYMYEVPKIGARTGFKPAGWILDNWQVSGITSFVTGAPFTPGFSTTDGAGHHRLRRRCAHHRDRRPSPRQERAQLLPELQYRGLRANPAAQLRQRRRGNPARSGREQLRRGAGQAVPVVERSALLPVPHGVLQRVQPYAVLGAGYDGEIQSRRPAGESDVRLLHVGALAAHYPVLGEGGVLAVKLAWVCSGVALVCFAQTSPDGWEAGAPRDEIRPRFSYEDRGGPGGAPALAIASDAREGLNGHWRKTFPVTGGGWYRFYALSKTENMAAPRRSAVVEIVWQDDRGKTAPTDMGSVEAEMPAERGAAGGGWTEVSDVYRAPKRATRAQVDLRLRWASGASVRWSKVAFSASEPPAKRLVRLAAAHFKPAGRQERRGEHRHARAAGGGSGGQEGGPAGVRRAGDRARHWRYEGRR